MTIRPIRREDNPAMAAIVRGVLTEFGCTGPGFAIHDPEVDCLYEAYGQPRCAYFIAEQDGIVAGGGGVAPLKGGDGDTCELQKYYLLPQARGKGHGGQLLARCLEAAKSLGFKRCYLETLEHMNAAAALYLRAGFIPLTGPLGGTGHFACNRWYVKEL